MYKKILIIFVTFTLFIPNSYTNENLIKKLKKGGNIIFIRHALAPGSGDPENFNIKNCSTQRNLNTEGIEQSKKIGLFFSNNSINVDLVLSSEWCRCKDTAKFAFNQYRTFSPLNSFYSEKFQKNKSNQVRDLKKYLSKWKGDENIILVTHYVVILEILGKAVSSGEIVISDQNFNFVGSITNY